LLGLRRNDRADVRETMHELGQKALVDINRELLKPKLQAFQKIEPLFCELFWNRDKGVEVKYVPKSYVRHLLQRRLKYSVDQQHDERQAETAAANFSIAAAEMKYVTSTSGDHAYGQESGYKLTAAGSNYLTKKFQSTPWYLRLINEFAKSWKVIIIGLFTGIVTIYGLFHDVIPWFVDKAIPWLETFGH